MTRTKTIFKSLLVSCLFFVASAVLAGNAMAAPRLYFDPANSSPQKGSDVTVGLKIDAENKYAFGADAVVIFPSGDLTIKSVTNGDFFSDFSYAQGTGRLEIHGFFSASFASKTASGTFANITFNSNKDTGTGAISMVCTAGENDTEIVDSNGQNILSCSSINQLNLSYGSTSSSVSQSASGSTNACGGTCGSNYNCNSGLFCTGGFCKNPDCPNDLTCGCKATTAPSTKPKPKTVSTTSSQSSAKSTPQVITLAKATPYPTFIPSTPMATTQSPSKANGALLWIGFIIAAAIAIFIAIKIIKKNKPPEINPPTTYPVQPPFQSPIQ